MATISKGKPFDELANSIGEFIMSSYFVKTGVLTRCFAKGELTILQIGNECFQWSDDERWNRRKLDLQIGDTIAIAGKVYGQRTRSPVFKGKALYVATTDETYGVPVGIGAFVMFVGLTLLACFLTLLCGTLILAPAVAPALFVILSGLRDFFVTRRCGRMLRKNAVSVQELAPAE